MQPELTKCVQTPFLIADFTKATHFIMHLDGLTASLHATPIRQVSRYQFINIMLLSKRSCPFKFLFSNDIDRIIKINPISNPSKCSLQPLFRFLKTNIISIQICVFMIRLFPTWRFVIKETTAPIHSSAPCSSNIPCVSKAICHYRRKHIYPCVLFFSNNPQEDQVNNDLNALSSTRLQFTMCSVIFLTSYHSLYFFIHFPWTGHGHTNPTLKQFVQVVPAARVCQVWSRNLSRISCLLEFCDNVWE